MSPSTVIDTDIAVVGGGPVGVVAALTLREAGFQVLLVERGAAPAAFDATRYDLRVYAIAPASARLLGQLGVWPQIAATRISPYTRMQVWERAAERGLRFDAADSGSGALGWIVEQGLILAAAWAQLGGTTSAGASPPMASPRTGFQTSSVRSRRRISTACEPGSLSAPTRPKPNCCQAHRTS